MIHHQDRQFDTSQHTSTPFSFTKTFVSLVLANSNLFLHGARACRDCICTEKQFYPSKSHVAGKLKLVLILCTRTIFPGKNNSSFIQVICKMTDISWRRNFSKKRVLYRKRNVLVTCTSVQRFSLNRFHPNSVQK